MMVKLLFVIVALCAAGCGSESKSKESPPSPTPSLKQQFLDAPALHTVGENAGLSTPVSIEIASRFPVSRTYAQSMRDYLKFAFTPQKQATDETSFGDFWISVGANESGTALETAQAIAEYETTHGYYFPDGDPYDYTFGARLSEGQAVSYGTLSFWVVDDSIGPADQPRGYIRTWYAAVTAQRSLIVRSASIFPFDDLWPELKSEMVSTIESVALSQPK